MRELSKNERRILNAALMAANERIATLTAERDTARGLARLRGEEVERLRDVLNEISEDHRHAVTIALAALVATSAPEPGRPLGRTRREAIDNGGCPSPETCASDERCRGQCW